MMNERSHDNVPSCPNYYTGSLYSVNPFSAILSSRRTLTQFSQQGVWKQGSLAPVADLGICKGGFQYRAAGLF